MVADDSISIFLGFLGQLLANLPLFIVWIGGGILIYTRMQRDSQSERFALAGIGLAIVLSLASSWLNVWLPITLYQNSTGLADVGIIMGGVGFITSLCAAVSWGLMIASVYLSLNDQQAN